MKINATNSRILQLLDCKKIGDEDIRTDSKVCPMRALAWKVLPMKWLEFCSMMGGASVVVMACQLLDGTTCIDIAK